MTSPSNYIRKIDRSATPHIVNESGFTLVEILVVVAIFAILAGIGLFMSFRSYQNSLYHSERDIAVALIEKARSQSMANVDQSPHGFCFSGGSYVVFEGTDCATAAIKEMTPAGSGVALSGPPAAGVVFSQLSGNPSWSGNMALTQGGNITTITINGEGMIDW